jgi:hypothetical protein
MWAYIVVLCLTVYIAPSDCITQRMENTKIKKKIVSLQAAAPNLPKNSGNKKTNFF